VACSRFGGHSHAVGFSLPAARVPELREHLDVYARTCLTLADFEPTLNFDAEISLDQVNPELFRSLQRLQPFGVGNPQPVFVARAVRLVAPPRMLKEKHVKLKLAATENREPTIGNWRNAIAFDALGWNLAERCQQAGLLVGDHLDVAFTIDNNDHPDYGGLELSIRDFKAQAKETEPKDKNDSLHSENQKRFAASP
jgi:single-stranded-DNA-specific exonuclease